MQVEFVQLNSGNDALQTPIKNVGYNSHMNRAQLEDFLHELPLAQLQYYQKTTSTNDAAIKWVEQGAQDMSLVVADQQTAGRGRSGRKWYTPPGCALAFSIILRPSLYPSVVEEDRHNNNLPHFRLTALGSMAVSTALDTHYEIPALIKWPNDLLVHGKKIAGVLVESIWDGDTFSAAVVGIGVNVAKPSIQLQDQFDTPADYIEHHSNSRVSRVELLRGVLTHFINWREHIYTDRFLETWNERLAFRGERVKMIPEEPGTGLQELEAYIENLEPDGGLKIRLLDGTFKLVYTSQYRISPVL